MGGASDVTATPVADNSGSEQTPLVGCDVMGMFDGLSVPCGYRIRLMARATFAGRSDGCEHAGELVRWQDSACAQCTQAASGCQDVVGTSTPALEQGSSVNPTTIISTGVPKDASHQSDNQLSATVSPSLAGFPTNSLY